MKSSWIINKINQPDKTQENRQNGTYAAKIFSGSSTHAARYKKCRNAECCPAGAYAGNSPPGKRTWRSVVRAKRKEHRPYPIRHIFLRKAPSATFHPEFTARPASFNGKNGKHHNPPERPCRIHPCNRGNHRISENRRWNTNSNPAERTERFLRHRRYDAPFLSGAGKSA